MSEAMKFYDGEGNEYTIAGSKEPDNIFLKDKEGNIQIVRANDLGKTYFSHPPEVWKAMEEIVAMLKSGEITQEDLRKFRDRKE
jgi:hypothetical protein